MILEALRWSVVRWFKRPATSVTPQIDRSPGGYSVTLQPSMFGFRPGMEYVGTPWSPPKSFDPSSGIGSEPAPSRLGVKPPADPELDNASWAWWETCRGTQRVPGWAYCRFANRVGDKAQFAFGYVRGSFGIWQKPFRTCTGFHPDVVDGRQLLTTATHLLTGHAIGLFDTIATAIAACELADRVAGEWAIEKDTQGLDAAILRTQQAWAGAGIGPSPSSHAHDEDDLPTRILTRSIESVMEGKPERLS